MHSPPSILFLLSGIGMMVVGILAIVVWRRNRVASWKAFGFGILAWTISVGLKFTWAVLTNAFVKQSLDKALPGWVAGPAFWLYIGLLTGIFECGIALLFVKWTRLKAADWADAVAFGIGFGAIEAFLLGLLNLIGILSALMSWDQLPEAARRTISNETGLGFAVIPLPVAERLFALVAHVLSCVLIVYSVRVGGRRWFWLSFIYKSALDAVAAWSLLATTLTKSLSGMIILETVVSVFAVIGLAGLVRLHRRFGGLASPEVISGTEPTSQIDSSSEKRLT